MVKPGIWREKLAFESNFTTIPNSWIRNTGLSINANFLLIYLLTHEIGYNITFDQIEREIGLGETAIRSAMNQLKIAGWLRTERTRDERGYNSGLAWFLTDPKAENPNLANPALDSTGLYNQATIENKSIKKTNKENNYVLFEEFWKAYPRKTAKTAARRVFMGLTSDDQQKALKGAVALSCDPNLPELQFVPHASTWLRGERWDDDPYPERKLTADELKARELRLAEERRLRDLERQKAVLEQYREAERKASENPPDYCEHGRIIAACMPCIRSGKFL